MCKNIRSHIDLYLALMGESNPFFHLLHGKILRFRPKAESFSTNINGVCSENHCGL